jgi:DNA helicase IV
LDRTVLDQEQERIRVIYEHGEALAAQLTTPVPAANAAAAKKAQEMRLERYYALREELDRNDRLMVVGRVDFSGGEHGGRSVYVGHVLVGDPDDMYPHMVSWQAEIAGAFFNPTGFEDGNSVELKRSLTGRERVVSNYIDERPKEIQRFLETAAQATTAPPDDSNPSEEEQHRAPTLPRQVDRPANRQQTVRPKVRPGIRIIHPGEMPAAAEATSPTDSPVPTQPEVAARSGPGVSSGASGEAPETSVVPATPTETSAQRTATGPTDPLIERLRDRQGTGLDSIVATIQARQYELMERPIDRTLVIQGGPGTGKTVIALHRIAVQLYRARGTLSQSDVLFIGPSRTFVRYVDRVLPSLGEGEVVHRAIEDLASYDTRPTDHDTADAALVKGLPQMAEVIDRYLRSRARVPDRNTSLGEGLLASIPPTALEPVLEEALREAPSYGGLRVRFRRLLAREDVIAALVSASASGAKTDTSLDPRRADALARSVVPSMSPREAIHGLLSSPDLLAAAAEGLLSPAQQATIREPDGLVSDHAWKFEDLPLLDEAAHQMSSGERPKQYAHVVIDEAQDFSAMQLRSVRRRTSGSLTILGDLAQATSGWTPATWEEHLASAGIEADDQEELTQSYRTTRPILDAANHLLLVIDVGLEPPRSVLEEGEPVVALQLSDPAQDGDVIADEIRRYRQDGRKGDTIGVIGTPTTLERIRVALEEQGFEPKDVEEDVAAPLVLVPVDAAKGLEYDHVLVLEPERIYRSNPATGPRKLYVAMTRARTSLKLLHRERLPRVLEAADDILRWIEPTAPDQESARSNVDPASVDGAEAEQIAGDPAEKIIGPCLVETGGGTVVLTDHPGIDRAQLIEKAELLGFAVRPEVSPSTSLLIVGKPDSTSRRARLARSLGVPIATSADLLSNTGSEPIAASRQPPGLFRQS